MLWYKAWLETRSRFAIVLIGSLVLCSDLVVNLDRLDRDSLSRHTVQHYFTVLQAVHVFLVFIWILAVILLMMGGLLREKAVGASSFTLALPVSRTRLMSVRLGMGLMQAIVLAIVPWIAMLSIRNVAGKTQLIPQACFHVFLSLGGGVIFLAIAFLISSLVEGEYTAPVVTLGASIMLIYASNDKKFVPYSPWTFMQGSKYFHGPKSLVPPVPTIPWMQAGIFVAIAALLAVISIQAIQRRDF